MKPQAFFRTLIAEPLEAVVGKRLQHVSYWLPGVDQPEFRVEAPNQSGLGAVSMVFADRASEILPSWETSLREGNAYHIQAQCAPDGKASQELAEAELLACIGVDHTTPWRDVTTMPLAAVEVYGFHSSPQVIRFKFPAIDLAVAIGYPGDSPLIGDGDEILVFSGEQWLQTDRTLPEPWIKLWEYGVSSS